MDSNPTDAVTAPAKSGLPTMGWLLLLLLVVYPLSTGPVFKLVEYDVIGFDHLQVIYAPLESLGKTCPPVERFFEWYVLDLWHVSIYTGPK